MTRTARIRRAQADLGGWLAVRQCDDLTEKALRSLACGLGALALSRAPHPVIVASVLEDIDVLEWATA